MTAPRRILLLLKYGGSAVSVNRTRADSAVDETMETEP